MRFLIIGGSGFIGRPLVRQIAQQGHQIAVLHRRARDAKLRSDIHKIIGDRRRLRQHTDAIGEFAPEVVIDLILSSGKQAEELVRTLREIKHRVVPRIVAISSMDVYRACGVLHGSEPGQLEPLPLNEESPLRTTIQTYPVERLRMLQGLLGWIDDEYDKIPVERAIMAASDLAGTILRLPMVYGPGDYLRRFFPIVKRISDQRPAILFADDVAAWRSPRGYVDNIAAAIALAATSPQAAGRIYNIAERDSFSELEWARKIANQLEWPGRFMVLPRERTPEHLLMPGNLAQHWVASSERIRRELGYAEVVSSDEAVRRTIDWELATPPLEISLATLDYAAEDAALAAP